MGAGLEADRTSRSSGKERDTETGLDYFGARYYGSNMGRWMSPDWNEAPEPIPYADLSDPQTLNLYGYVRNNPITYLDADGHDCPVCPDLESVRDLVNQGYQEGKALIATGAAYTAGATAATGAAVVGAFYLADTRITDAYIANKKDEENQSALESRVAGENKQALQKQEEAKTATGGAGSRKGGGRNEQKSNQDRTKTAQDKIKDLKQQRDALNSATNKTPADKEKLDKINKAINRETDRIKKSETHSRKKKGPQ